MSINKLVNIRIPVLNALEDMGQDITKGLPTYTRWAADAEKKIGSYYSFRRKNIVLTVNGCRAELPCDAAFVKALLIGDFGCDCGDLFNKCYQSAIITGSLVTDTFLVIDATPQNELFTITGVKWEVQDNNIIFSTALKNQKVTVQYLGLQTDADNFPMVVEDHIPAIVEYIMWRYGIRSRFSPIKMDHADIERHRREWHTLAACARADDAMLTDSDRMEIVAMIHDSWGGYGLEAGMRNRNDNYTGYAGYV